MVSIRRRKAEPPTAPPPDDAERAPDPSSRAIRAIGIAGDQVSIAPTLFGVKEIAWSAHPDESFEASSSEH